MRTDTDNLKQLYQEYVASRKPSSRKRCPSTAAILKSFEPSGSLRKKKRIIDHISECPFCREEFMMLFERRESGDPSAEVSTTTAHSDPQPITASVRKVGHRLIWQYACVLLGLSFTISSLFLLVQQKELSEVRQEGDAGLMLLYPDSNQSLSGPLIFRWERRVATDYYVLELFDEALLPIWTSEKIRDVQIQIPFDVYSGLRPGKSYYWMVTAFFHDSRTAESKLARFVILR